jgi:dienelactone hydrolase
MRARFPKSMDDASASWGARTAVRRRWRRLRGFAAGIALYPRCGFFTQFRGSAPLLILAGELDDWTPAAECRLLANAEKVTLKVYPGVHHSFDSPRPKRYVAERINPSSPSGRGATTEGNAAAWADSIREVQAFFARHLKDAN